MLQQNEVTDKPAKKRNFMFEIENAKRLLPSNCQEKPGTTGHGQERLY